MEYNRPPSMEETRDAFKLVADTDILKLEYQIDQLNARRGRVRNDPWLNPAYVPGLDHSLESKKRTMAEVKAVEEQLAQEQQRLTDSFNNGGLAP